jgi:hypothetical protein
MRSHPLRVGRSETHYPLQRVEKLERSNTVHGLWGGEGVSLTLVVSRETTKDAVSIR